MFVSLKRIIKIGYNNFSRNLSLNAATVFVMTIVIFLISFLFIFNLASNILITNVKQKVDVSVYFVENATTEDVLAIKTALSEIPEVKEVEYVSKEEALEKFIERHKNDPILMDSLNEIGINPFVASLNIRAYQVSQYEKIVKFLEGDSYKSLIQKVDYFERKPIIERLHSITDNINKIGISVSIILVFVALLIAFNTIKIAIYGSKEEISVMRLVGASNWFIRGPFLVQGVIAGVLSSLFALIIVFIVSYSLTSPIKTIAPDINILGLFLNNFWILLLIELALGIALGTLSSVIAIRKYLKV